MSTMFIPTYYIMVARNTTLQTKDAAVLYVVLLAVILIVAHTGCNELIMLQQQLVLHTPVTGPTEPYSVAPKIEKNAY